MNKENLIQNNTPALRFPPFTEGWVRKKLGDVAPLQRGFDLPVDKIIKGQYPVVFSNGILKFHNEFKATAPGVVTGRSGTIGKVTFVEKDYWPHNTSLWVTNFMDNYPKFIFYFYSKYNLERFGTGSGVPTLNRNDVHSQEEYFPSNAEQQKIATFFTAIDKKLSGLKEKKNLLEQYKKGAMQQLFAIAETDGRPSVRFKNTEGGDFADWEEKKLGDIGTFFSGGTPLTSKRQYFNGNIPFIRSGEIHSDKTEQFISEEGLKNSSAKIVEVGDLLYALYGATSGEVGISKIKGAINQALLCIRTKMDNRFLNNFLFLNKENIIKTYLQGGQGNLSADIIKSLVIPIPCLAEQTQIANYLSALDEKIQGVSTQLEKMERWKKGLLQQMFV